MKEKKEEEGDHDGDIFGSEPGFRIQILMDAKFGVNTLLFWVNPKSDQLSGFHLHPYSCACPSEFILETGNGLN